MFKLTDFNAKIQSQIAAQLDADRLRAVETKKPKPPVAQTLECGERQRQIRKGKLVVVIDLIAARHRLLDCDNNVGSFKPLRDAIAESIGIDDGDSRIKWSYGQIQTQGEEGVIVRVSVL